MKLTNIGFGNYISQDRILAVMGPDSAPMKRFKDESKSRGFLVDATQGRRTRSIIILDSGHVVLSGIQAETLAQRISGDK